MTQPGAEPVPPVAETDRAFGHRWDIPPSLRDALNRGLLVLAGASIVYLFVQIAMYRYGRDQGIYAEVADTMLRGGMPYRDAWDFKPPGIFAIYALARALFGHAEWGIRLFEIVGLSSVVLAFTILARRFLGDWRIGLVGGAMAVVVHAELEFWHTGQPESFGGMLIAWALVLATFQADAAEPHARRKQLGAWALAGALYGFTFLLKPPLAGGVIASSLFAAWQTWRTHESAPLAAKLRRAIVPVVVMAAASLSVIALCAAWFVMRGAFDDLYQTLFVFTPHYTKLSWQDATMPGMLYLAIEEWLVTLSGPNAAGLLAAFICAPLAKREREGVLHVLAVIFIQLVGVAMQAKFFPYHYGASLILGSFIAGLGAYKVWQLSLSKGWLALAAFAVVVPIIFFARSATRNTQTDFWERCLDRQNVLLGLSRQTRQELDDKLYSVADVNYGANREVANFYASASLPRSSSSFGASSQRFTGCPNDIRRAASSTTCHSGSLGTATSRERNSCRISSALRPRPSWSSITTSSPPSLER